MSKKIVTIMLVLMFAFTAVVLAEMSDYYQQRADREYKEGRAAQKKAAEWQKKASQHFENAERYQKQADRARKNEQQRN